MSATTVSTTVQIQRGHLFGLVGVVAVLAAVVTWALAAYAFPDNNTAAATPSIQPSVASAPSAAQDARRVPSIMSLTPAALASGALGTGYALPSVQGGPTLASVLASMSPQTRAYTKAIMAQTFAQLAAGGGGRL